MSDLTNHVKGYKANSSYEKQLLDNNITEGVEATFIIIEDTWQKLMEYDEKIIQLMVDKDKITEEYYEKEEEVINGYTTKYNIMTIKLKVSICLQVTN